MNKYPKPLMNLINEFNKLPGIGSKSSQKLAFHILSMDEKEVSKLSDALITAKRELKRCPVCGNLTDKEVCDICSDTSRDQDTILVVESPKDVILMERLQDYTGVYHVLHGAISPVEGIGPEDINLMSLIKRLEGRDVKEIIVATNPTIEGEATAVYISRLIKPAGIKVTRIAHGVPVGSELEFSDEITLLKSFEGRHEI